MFGTLYKPSEALSIGLVDELAPDNKTAEQRCLEVLSQLNSNVPNAVYASKASLRKDLVDRFIANRKHDTDYSVKFLNDPKMKEKFGAYLVSLRQRKK